MSDVKSKYWNDGLPWWEQILDSDVADPVGALTTARDAVDEAERQTAAAREKMTECYLRLHRLQRYFQSLIGLPVSADRWDTSGRVEK
jgi:hypothetical protein